MIKCILIYLWIYIGIYYVIAEAADADEHVHIKLHMPRGQRKHTQHHHHTRHKKRQIPLHYNSDALPPREPPQLYHETPHNYLTPKTTTPQNHLHHSQHTKKLPTSHLHETIGQLLEADDVYSSSDADSAADSEEGEHMTYLAENFALFPQPSISTSYETELRPQKVSQGFGHMVKAPEETDEDDNEISGPGDEVHDSELIMLEEEPRNYQRHRPYAEGFTSPMKNEQQLLQQIFQQQQEQHQQQHNQFEQAEIMKTAKLRGNKYKNAEKQYHSEEDMTESMMYSPLPHSTTTFSKGNNDKVTHSGSGFKSMTVDDIWTQLQRQYLNKYVPQAQSQTDADDDAEGGIDETSLKSTTKKKRTTIRQKHIKPSSLSSIYTSSRQPTSSFWPAKTLNYENNHHQQPHSEDSHSYYFSPSSTLSSLTTSSRDAELFDDTRAFRRPYNKFNGHNSASHHHTDTGDDFHVANDDDAVRIQFDNDNVDAVEDDNNSHDASFEDSVYQRGKKYAGHTGHVAYSNNSANNPFNYHDLYGAYSTPITATVATKVHPSTYHPKLTKASTSISSAYPAFYGDSVSPTLSHESTSYQWHTQQHNPVSYQSYQSHHQQESQQQQQQQQQQQHLQHQRRFRQLQPQSSALRLPTATITQMPSTASTAISSTFASSLSPTMSNDFISSPATKATVQSSRYKKRKNRIKTKKTRIVVL